MPHVVTQHNFHSLFQLVMEANHRKLGVRDPCRGHLVSPQLWSKIISKACNNGDSEISSCTYQTNKKTKKQPSKKTPPQTKKSNTNRIYFLLNSSPFVMDRAGRTFCFPSLYSGVLHSWKVLCCFPPSVVSSVR